MTPEFARVLRDEGYHAFHEIPGGKWAGISDFLFTSAIIVGRLDDRTGYEDRWCYGNHQKAEEALLAWASCDYSGEPGGWHRHPGTGRRRSYTEEGFSEHVNLGE